MLVGLTAEKLDEILEQRVRSRNTWTFASAFRPDFAEEITDYYNAVYVPRVRARGQIVPRSKSARRD